MSSNNIVKDPVDGLVQFVLDVKPFHTKILDVLIEYVYGDVATVTITENLEMTISLLVDHYVDGEISPSSTTVKVAVTERLQLDLGMEFQDLIDIHIADYPGEYVWDSQLRSTHILSIDDVANSILVSGNRTELLFGDSIIDENTPLGEVGGQLIINDSINNDGTYTVASSVYDYGSNTTEIFVNENLDPAFFDSSVMPVGRVNDPTSPYYNPIVRYELPVLYNVGEPYPIVPHGFGMDNYSGLSTRIGATIEGTRIVADVDNNVFLSYDSLPFSDGDVIYFATNGSLPSVFYPDSQTYIPLTLYQKYYYVSAVVPGGSPGDIVQAFNIKLEPSGSTAILTDSGSGKVDGTGSSGTLATHYVDSGQYITFIEEDHINDALAATTITETFFIQITGQTYSDAISNDSPTMYLELEEAAGNNTLIDSVNSNDAVITASYAGIRQLSSLIKTGTCLGLSNQSTDVINVPIGLTTPSTLEMWIATTDVGTIASNIDGIVVDGDWELEVLINGMVQFTVFNTLGNLTLTSNSVINNGLPTHIAVSQYSDGVTHLYVNGTQQGFSPVQPYTVNTNSFTVGSRADTTQPLSMLIDEIVLYNTVISAVHVSERYAIGVKLPNTVPLAWNNRKKATLIQLTNADETASVHSTIPNTVVHSVYSSVKLSTFKYYWEVDVSCEAIGETVGVGIGTDVQLQSDFDGTLTSSLQYVGSTTNSWGVWYPSGQVFNNNVLITTLDSITGSATTRLGFAYDQQAGKLWVRTASGYFSSADPSNPSDPGNVDSISLSLFNIISSLTSGTSSAIYLNSGDWNYAAPVGFDAVG